MGPFNRNKEAYAQALETLAGEGLPVAQLLNGYRAYLEVDLAKAEAQLAAMLSIQALVHERIKDLEAHVANLRERMALAQPWIEEGEEEGVAD